MRMKVRPAVIRQSLEAMRKQVAGMENPLLEAGASLPDIASPSATRANFLSLSQASS